MGLELKFFTTASNGKQIENPHCSFLFEKGIKEQQRIPLGKKIELKIRKKLIKNIQRLYQGLGGINRDFLRTIAKIIGDFQCTASFKHSIQVVNDYYSPSFIPLA